MDEVKEKILFQVSSVDEGTACKVNIDGKEDLFQVAIAINDLIVSNPELLEIIRIIAFMMATDPKFKEMKDSHTIKMPDFDKLLKEE